MIDLYLSVSEPFQVDGGTYDNLQDVADVSSFLESVAAILASFPIENYATLKMIFSFLGEMLKFEEKTKMTSSNLALVIGPNVIRSVTESEGAEHFALINQISELLIVHQVRLFQVSALDIVTEHPALI